MTMKKNGHAHAPVGRTTATTEKNGHAHAPVGRTTATMKKNGHAHTTVSRATAVAHANGGGAAASAELRAVLSGLQAMSHGDFSVRLPGDWTGLEGKIADKFNEIVAANQRMSQELQRVGQVVGKEGKTRERVRFAEAKGAWGEMEVSVNTLVDDLLRPTTEV